MGLPVTVYTSEDAGAPQIAAGKASEVIAILKACLVDGYGAKSGLGWSVAFEDVPTFKIAFRNSTTDASGGFFQIWSATETDISQTQLYMRGARSMTGLDSFVDGSYQQALRFATSVKHWALVGTSAGFYFMGALNLTVDSNGTTESAIFFVGDIHSYYANDAGRFTTVARPGLASDMTSSNWSHYIPNISSASASYSQINKLYDTDGSSGYQSYSFGSEYMQGSYNVTGVPSGNRIFTDITIEAEGNPATPAPDGYLGESQLRPWIRGRMPGALNTPQSGYKGDVWPVYETINGESYLLMNGYYYGRFWINTEQWYD